MNTIYNISDCPITGMKRKVEVTGNEVSNKHKWARLDCEIIYFLQTGEAVPEDLMPRKKVVLIAANDEKVNPLTGEYDENGIGEFDWMDSMATQLNMQAMYDRAIQTAITKNKF